MMRSWPFSDNTVMRLRWPHPSRLIIIPTKHFQLQFLISLIILAYLSTINMKNEKRDHREKNYEIQTPGRVPIVVIKFSLLSLVLTLPFYCFKMSQDIDGHVGIEMRIVGKYKAKWTRTDHIINFTSYFYRAGPCITEKKGVFFT